MLLGGAAIGNYTVPLLIGARDMAFPRLNAFAFWLAVPARAGADQHAPGRF
jgi:cytochrome c oxidase subunit I